MRAGRHLLIGIAAAVALPVFAAAQAKPGEHVDVPREQWQRVADILTELGATPGAVIADVGAGSGYFTTRIAKAVGAGGRVYAVDVNPVSLRELRDTLGDSYANVEIVRGEEDSPKLPAATLDGVLVVNAYHEFVLYPQMLAALYAALEPGGRIVLVEPIPRAADTTRAAQTRRHAIAIELVEADVRAAGFEIVKTDVAFVSRPGHMAAERGATAAGATDWLLVARRPAGVLR